jgi:PleD family two-component response regulator
MRDVAHRNEGPQAASLGVATYPAHGETVDTSIARADEAPYAAERGGRDRVVIAS